MLVYSMTEGTKIFYNPCTGVSGSIPWVSQPRDQTGRFIEGHNQNTEHTLLCRPLVKIESTRTKLLQ